MPVITLPDGSERRFDHPVSVGDVAADIGAGLAKAALAGRVDGRLVDLSYTITEDAQVAIVTSRDEDGLEVIRHSTAHLLGQAVKELFPEAQVTIGPVVDNGFYYDFAYSRSFTPEDVVAIEARMHELAEQDLPVNRSEMPRDEAIAFFRGMGEEYKARIIEDIPADEVLSLYSQGNFIDLCRGPHVPSTGKLGAFKLTKLAGAYWRGDARNEMLQRVYGTAWADKKALKAYLHQLEEAEKRDHRRIGRQLDLFHVQEEAPGMVFWHAKGWSIWSTVERYMRGVYDACGYQEVRSPQVVDVSLWKRSGHWENYKEHMFFTESEKREYALKPMNCPGHVQIFNHALRSYRDLPLRYGEFGACHRNEASGALHGIMRVRGFTQDDGHIFCTEAQIEEEVAAFHEQAMRVYADFGFTDVSVKIALRPDARLGSDADWDKAEDTLRNALRRCNVDWEELPGEGAFYSPKVEYHLKDAIGREWQVGTIQADYQMPLKLGAEYIDENSQRKTPVMLHRAILGSLERFIGILIEHHEGRFPLWLSPVQVVVANITDRQAEYASEVARALRTQGYRATCDLRNEKIGFKIREHTLQRVPFLLVVGDREADERTVSVRTREGEDLGGMPLEVFVARLAEEPAPNGHRV
ncbi:threonine--tRNA ligase [Acidihalobacter aeolianus]|uniref:Threonine--tRNA ligase n=1 Tax=Acidihalobacter aeolianus TaxID=2792603 RepID=A0A1D8K8C1_9GAMM|nr:threonine--tRNA ligase [Acidihalobacter aeolianus]AOV17190.1 threonine--tRNA ligase [Acidihalobacter aeolianus]